jgi:bacillithiol biosynthesis cysteine-adding enzyme BshC
MELERVPLGELREALRGLLYADEALALAEECYQPGRTAGEAFRLLMERLLGGRGLVYLDPMQPEIRELAAPLLKEALERGEELSEALRRRNAELKEAGYHAQVLFEERTSLFFKLEGGRRLQLRRHGEDYFHEARKLAREELAAAPQELSPSALLRPVMQDYLLPTAAYVGGPAELAYLAQSETAYRALLGRMPAAVPRAGFTLLDARARALMDKYGLALPDCFHGLEALKERIARRVAPAALEEEFARGQAEVSAAAERLERLLGGFDATLAGAMAKSKAKMLYQVDKNRRKAAREALRRNAAAEEGAARLSRLAYPERVLQERFYSPLAFVAQHGTQWIREAEEHIHLGCADHIVLTV